MIASCQVKSAPPKVVATHNTSKNVSQQRGGFIDSRSKSRDQSTNFTFRASASQTPLVRSRQPLKIASTSSSSVFTGLSTLHQPITASAKPAIRLTSNRPMPIRAQIPTITPLVRRNQVIAKAFETDERLTESSQPTVTGDTEVKLSADFFDEQPEFKAEEAGLFELTQNEIARVQEAKTAKRDNEIARAQAESPQNKQNWPYGQAGILRFGVDPFGDDVIKDNQGYTTDADGNNNVFAIDSAKMEESEGPNLLLVAGAGLAVATSLIAVTAVLPKNEAAFVYNKAEQQEIAQVSVVYKDIDEIKNLNPKNLTITDTYEAPATKIAPLADVADVAVNSGDSAAAEFDQPIADVTQSGSTGTDSLPEYDDLVAAAPMRVSGLGSSEPVVE